MTDELKPCPFCGYNAEIVFCIGSGLDTGNWIVCPVCNLTLMFATERNIKIWNTRTLEDAQAAEIAWLRAALDEISLFDDGMMTSYDALKSVIDIADKALKGCDE